MTPPRNDRLSIGAMQFLKRGKGEPREGPDAGGDVEEGVQGHGQILQEGVVRRVKPVTAEELLGNPRAGYQFCDVTRHCFPFSTWVVTYASASRLASDEESKTLKHPRTRDASHFSFSNEIRKGRKSWIPAHRVAKPPM